MTPKYEVILCFVQMQGKLVSHSGLARFPMGFSPVTQCSEFFYFVVRILSSLLGLLGILFFVFVLLVWFGFCFFLDFQFEVDKV